MANINETAEVRLDVNGKEAVDELQRIRKETEKVNQALAQTNDKEEIKKLRNQLKGLQSEMQAVRSSARNIDEAMRHLDTSHAKEIRRLIKDIKGQLESGFVKRGTQEWDDYVKKLNAAKQELKHIYDEQVFITRQEPPKGIFNNLMAGAKKVWSAFDLATRAVDFLYSKISKYIDALSQKQEAAIGLQAMTGLSDTDIEYLTHQAERLATSMDDTGLRVRKSSREILEAYAMVGSAKPELQGDAEALHQVTVEALRLSEATRSDLQSSVAAVTITLNQFGDGADQAARYTNVLAAGAKDGAAGINDLAASFGSSGTELKAANLSVEQSVSLFEALARQGIKGGEAGSALQRILHALAKTGTDELNPAVVGLDKALQNLDSAQLTTNELTQLFGERGAKAARVLIDSAPDIAAYTEQISGTSVATDQAARNSDTYAARAAQAANAMDEAGQKLAAGFLPVLEEVNATLTDVVPLLSMVFEWFSKIAGLTFKSIIPNWMKAAVGTARVVATSSTVNRQAEQDAAKGIGDSAAAGFGIADAIRRQMDSREVKEAEKEAVDKAKKIADAIREALKSGSDKQKPSSSSTTDPLKQQLEDLDKAAELLQNIANIQRRNGAMTEQQYAAELLRINVALYTKKRDLYRKDSAEWVKWESKRLDEEKKISDQLAQELTKQGAEHLAEETRRRNKMEQLRRQYDSAAVTRQEGEAELAVLESLHAQGLLEEEEYQRMRLAIRKKYSADGKKEQPPFSLQHADDAFGLSGTFAQMAQTVAAARTAQEEIARLEAEGEITHEQAAERRKAIDDNMWQNYAAQAQAAFSMVGSLMNAASSLMQANQDLELAKVEARYAKEVEAAGNSTKKREQLEKKKAAEEAAIKKKYNDRAMKIEIAQAIAQTAQAAIAAYASAAAIPVTGWIMAPIAAALATAAGAIQIATIRKQHAAQAAGYYEGGFTGGRRYRREAGVVHEGEFVANHQAVDNPALRPLLNLIDTAQRNNRVASLTPEDITLAAAAPMIRAAQATPTPEPSPTAEAPQAATSISIDPRHTAALDRLARQLEHPIHAIVTIDGPDGVKQNLDRFNQIQNNK